MSQPQVPNVPHSLTHAHKDRSCDSTGYTLSNRRFHSTSPTALTRSRLSFSPNNVHNWGGEGGRGVPYNCVLFPKTPREKQKKKITMTMSNTSELYITFWTFIESRLLKFSESLTHHSACRWDLVLQQCICCATGIASDVWLSSLCNGASGLLLLYLHLDRPLGSTQHQTFETDAYWLFTKNRNNRSQQWNSLKKNLGEKYVCLT